MSYQRCLATHPSNPPEALGGLRLCDYDYDRLTDALTGPSAAEDPTIECAWGVHTWYGVAGYSTREQALRALTEQNRRYRLDQESEVGRQRWKRPPVLLAGDGRKWIDPRRYLPGGIARDWVALELRDKTIRTGEPAPYVSNGAAEAPLPIDAAVADIRLRITHALAYWVRLHADGRNLAQPAAGTIYTTTAWLAVHCAWAAAQDWAGEYADNLRELRAQARTVVDLPRPRTFQVGSCICFVNGHRCPGTLHTIARDPGDPTPLVIYCDTCGAAYPSTQWKGLGDKVNPPGRTDAA